MSTIKLGTRRLYDALGVCTNKSGEIKIQKKFAIGKTVSIYIGPKPPHGIYYFEGARFAVPGRKSPIFKSNNEHESSCYLEISVLTQRTITPGQLAKLKNKDNKLQEKFLDEARRNPEETINLLDAISGALALRLHRQLILSPLIENVFIYGDFEPTRSYESPSVEMLEGINTNVNTQPHINRMMEGMAQAPIDVLLKAGSILHWLLKAWKESDSISRFMYLFIPLESLMQFMEEQPSDFISELEEIEIIVKSCDATNKDKLLQFIKNAKKRFGPTLNSRFEAFARSAAIPGWELDVQAFKKFNRMRNLLLHAGKKNVRSHINFDENTRTLEDLVERYISFALTGSAEVYQSRWRPLRNKIA